MANDFSWDSRCKALYGFGSGALTADSIGSNTLTNNNSVAEDLVNFKEGACSAYFDNAINQYLSIVDANLDSGFPCKSGETNRSFLFPFWFKPDAVGVAALSVLFGKFGGSSLQNSFYVYMLKSTKKIILAVYRDGTDTVDGLTHDSALNDDGNHWYHIIISFNSITKERKISIYDYTAGAILGTDKTDIWGYTVNIGNAPFSIASSSSSNLGGNVDEFGAFNSILGTNATDKIRAGTYTNPAPAKTMAFYSNKITASSMITASTEATNYGKANLVDSVHSTCWRSTGVSSESLLIDFGEAQAVDTIALGNHNFLGELTKLELQYGTTDSCADGYVNLLDDITETDFIKFFFSVSYRYWKLVIEGADDITYYEIGELWLGVHVELDKNPLPQIDPYDKEYVVQERGLNSYNLYGYIDWPLKWGSYNNADNHTKLLALYNTVKLAKPFWIMLDPQNVLVPQHVVIREFNFNQYLGVGYPGTMRVVSSL